MLNLPNPLANWIDPFAGGFYRVTTGMKAQVLLVAADAPLVFGLDDPLGRRWGARIAARGIYALLCVLIGEDHHQYESLSGFPNFGGQSNRLKIPIS